MSRMLPTTVLTTEQVGRHRLVPYNYHHFKCSNWINASCVEKGMSIKMLRKPFFRNFRTFGPCFSWRSESTASSAQRKVSWQWRVSLSWLISRGVWEFTCSHGQWLSPYLTSELCWPGHAVIFPLSTVWYQNCSVRTFCIFQSRADQHHLRRG